MSKKTKIGSAVVCVLAVLLSFGIYLHHTNVQVLNPKGPIALKERNLLYLVLALSLIVVVPVFTAAIVFSLHYREGNKQTARYSPNWDHSRKVETVWWLVPTALITVLSVITWQSTQALTPSKPLASKNPTMVVQVVALDWKWLFIYPKQHIATINYVAFPKQTPVDFEITADAPMNSFWIPQLGGQIYAMAGMTTNLNLMASVPGNFRGLSANISGEGFSGMDFTAHASSRASFNRWVTMVQQSNADLTTANYQKLSQPSENNAVQYYASADSGLFNAVINKYMMPASQNAMQTDTSMQGMDMQQ
jgi:cytochrome o ubiquinol oxidase subunit 2